ncbi:hypothetical protein NM688_g9439 [Phlebia brevispora]|uniref:Uncharacterized protein n=1 Tax=Phlebia brevispora TaxID=194682 RepID=A0ACC1RJY6_9APHY|nr:hypothetical protein NM688_g9439 [Phlebia brevispora]
MLPAVLTGLLAASSLCYGIRIPIERRDDPPHSTSVNFSTSANGINTTFGFQNVKNNRYTGTLTVSGIPFTVILDTGSTDIWLVSEGAISSTTSTNVQGSIHYVTSSVTGEIELADMSFGNFSVKQQAFINLPSDQFADITQPQGLTGLGSNVGLMGLGPTMRSEIVYELNQTNFKGTPLIDNIFSMWPSDPNYMSFLLTRNNLGITDGGIFTIGEVAETLSDIQNATKLMVANPGWGAWVTFMDAVTINGVNYTGNSMPSKDLTVPAGKVSVVFDTGTPLGMSSCWYGVNRILTELARHRAEVLRRCPV